MGSCPVGDAPPLAFLSVTGKLSREVAQQGVSVIGFVNGFSVWFFFKLYLAHISRVRNCGDHVLLCFPLTRNVVCTVGLCPAYIAAPTQGSLLMCIKRASLWPSWRLPEAISGLCHPNVFIVAETQLESPELENREEIHVFFLFKLFNSKG